MAAGKIARELRRFTRPARDRLPPPRGRIALGRDPIELHSLVCARDVPMSLWSLESFLAFSGMRPRIVIHGDGTLRDEHRQLYERRFDPVVLHDGAEWEARVDAALAGFPSCRRMRRDPDSFCARKLFDPLFSARSATLLLIDSDVLFFRRPARLLEHARAGRACFASDCQDFYSAPRAALQRWWGRALLPCLNAGLLCIPVEAYRQRLELVERFLAHAQRALRDVDPNRHEQTAHALLMSALGAARLPPAYQIVGRLEACTVSNHFVGEGRGRKDFWDLGVPRVERLRLAQAWSAWGPRA